MYIPFDNILKIEQLKVAIVHNFQFKPSKMEYFPKLEKMSKYLPN